MIDSKQQLLINTGQKVREAIITRAEGLQEPLLKYDAAVANGNEDEIITAAIGLCLLSSALMDPVQRVICQWAELDKILAED